MWNMLDFSGSSCNDQGSSLPLHTGVLPIWAEAVGLEATSPASLFTDPLFRGAGKTKRKKKGCLGRQQCSGTLGLWDIMSSL